LLLAGATIAAIIRRGEGGIKVNIGFFVKIFGGVGLEKNGDITAIVPDIWDIIIFDIWQLLPYNI